MSGNWHSPDCSISSRWEDGVPYKTDLKLVDRWRVQNSNSITVYVSETTIHIKQEPRLLDAARAGVGACLWDSSFVLTAFLSGQDSLKWCGARVTELGAGLGLPGIFLALQGAKVVLTDKQSVLPLLHHNVLQNSGAASRSLNVSIEELDWDSPCSHRRLEELGALQSDYFIAADCLYTDEGGETPGVDSFIAACAALCRAPQCCCYIALERRASNVLEAFFGAARTAGFTVDDVAPNETMTALQADHVMVFEMRKIRRC